MLLIRWYTLPNVVNAFYLTWINVASIYFSPHTDHTAVKISCLKIAQIFPLEYCIVLSTLMEDWGKHQETNSLRTLTQFSMQCFKLRWNWLCYRA